MMITRAKGTREAPFSQIPSSRDTPGASPGISDRSDGFRLRRDETGFSLWRDIGRSPYGLSVGSEIVLIVLFLHLHIAFEENTTVGDERTTELKQRIIIAVFLLQSFPKVRKNLLEKQKSCKKLWLIVIDDEISKKSNIILYYIDENF